MTYHRMRGTYLYLPVMIFAILIITVPVTALDDIVGCGTPTPTPTPVAGTCILAVDATSTGQTSGGSSITIPHTTSGIDRLMLVGVSVNDDNHETVSSVTYNGVALTRVGTIDNSRSGGNDARVEIWRLIAPATGTNNVVITFSAPLAEQAVAGVMTFTGADQSTPLGPFASAENDPSPAAVTVTSATGDLVLGVVASEYGAITTDPGQAERWDIHAGSSETYGAGSTKAGASSVTLKWTVGCDAHWAAGGVSIRACSSPTPPPPPPASFICPESTPSVQYESLVATDKEVVGCLAITNDRTYLYVTVSKSPFVTMDKVSWTWSTSLPTGINGNPLPDISSNTHTFQKDEKFPYSFPGVKIDQVVRSDADTIYLSATAVVEKGAKTCTWISSDKKETYAAYNNPKLGPDAGASSPRYGTAVEASIDPYHTSSLYLATDHSHYTFDHGIWIWESRYVKNPSKGDIVDFTKTFTLDGKPESGTLWITADDGYDVSLNGVGVGKEGLNSGWRASNLKYAYVPGHGLWKSVEQYDLMNALLSKEGTNTYTLFIQTANRYMNCDNYLPKGVTATDSDYPTDSGGASLVAPTGTDLVACGGTCAEPKGTTSTNIGGLIYQAKICTSSSSTKDAWVLGTGDAKIFGYTVKRFNIFLSPAPVYSILPEKTSQTITATVKDRETVIPGSPIEFTTDFGTFTAGKPVTTTDNNGQAAITLSSSAFGTSTLTVWIDANGDHILDPNEWVSSTRVYWTHPARITLEPQTATVQLPNEDQDFIATVYNESDKLLENVPVTFTTSFGSIAEPNPAITDDLGIAEGTVSSPTVGTAKVTAFIDANENGLLDSGELAAESTVEWQDPPAPTHISLSPGSATNQLPDQAIQVFTGNVEDQYWGTMDGVELTFSTTLGVFPDNEQVIVVATKDLGRAETTVTSTDPGTATVNAWFDTDGDKLIDDGEPIAAFSTVTWLPAPTVTTLTLSPESATLELHSPASQVITATVLDQNGKPMPALAVMFTTVFGSGDTQSTMVYTDDNGQAGITVTSSTPDMATITASAGELSTTSFVVWLATPEASDITLAASPATTQLPDATPVSLTATVKDQYDHLMPDTMVTFTTAFNDGTNTVTTETTVPTGSDGVARTTLGETTAGAVTVTAASGDAMSSPVIVTWEPAAEPTIEPAAEPTTEPAAEPTVDPATAQN